LHPAITYCSNAERTTYLSPRLYDIEQFTEDLSTLKSGKTIEIPMVSKESAKINGDKARAIKPVKTIIVEGFSILSTPELRELIDEVYYIDIPDKEMVKRRLLRSRGDYPWDLTEYIVNHLIEYTDKNVRHQKKYASRVLDCSKPTTELTNIITLDIENY